MVDLRLGRLLVDHDDRHYPEIGSAMDCGLALGRILERGEWIGTSGRVGSHGFFFMRFKVHATERNPTVRLEFRLRQTEL